MDLTALSPEQFHHLCARLLSSAGFGLLTLPPKAHDLGIDLYVCARGESLFAVQIKHKIRRVVTGIQLRQTLKGLQDSVKLLGATGAILIIPAVLPQQVRSLLKTAPDTEIWDHLKLVQVISQDHNIEIEVEAMLRAQN